MKSLKCYFVCAMAVMLLCASAMAAFVINEFDSDTANTPTTDYAEFIELKGNPGESATGLVLVWFNGGTSGSAGVSYRATDLDGVTADSNGYILLGTTAIAGCDQNFPGNKLQNGEDALALYVGDATSFPTGSPCSSTNLIDHVIYETGADTDADWSGFGSPTWTVIDENQFSNAASRSLARNPDTTGPFGPSIPTPRGANPMPSYRVNQSWLTPAGSFAFPPLRVNQTMAQGQSQLTFEIENMSNSPLTVSFLDLDGSSSSNFSVVTSPTLPATLAIEQTVALVVGFQETDVSVNKVYNGSVSYVCDSPTTPSGTVSISAELTRVTETASAGAVKINEICPNPGAYDYNNDGSTASQNDEFIELYNTTASPIAVSGWEITTLFWDTPDKYSFVFPAGATIGANGYLVMFTGGAPTGFAPGTAFARATLQAIIRNTGSYTDVNDGTTRIDGVAYLSAEDNPDVDGFTNMGVSAVAGGSIGRWFNGADSFMAFDPTDPVECPTPGLPNIGPTSARIWHLYAD